METLGHWRTMMQGVAAWYRMPFVAFPQEEFDDIAKKSRDISILETERRKITEADLKRLPDNADLGEEASKILTELRKKYDVWCSAIYDPPIENTPAEKNTDSKVNKEGKADANK